MGAYSFTYNGFTPTQLDGKHEISIVDGDVRFSQDFLVTSDTDANMATAIAAAIAALSVQNKAFTFTLGGNSILPWDPAANTAFLTRPVVRKVGGPKDTARGVRLRFELTAQRQPQVAARAGRREATAAVAYTADRLRTATFSGVYTAVTGPTTALAQYTAQITSWIEGDYLGSGDLFAPASGAVWVLVEEPQVQIDDENKLARFTIRYREQKYASTPSNVTDGVFTIGTFTRIDPSTFGASLNLGGAAGGEPDPTGSAGRGFAGQYAGQDTTPTGPGTTAQPKVAFQRFSVSTTTWIKAIATNQNTFFNTVVRPWITASLAALFGAGRCVFEQPTVSIGDIPNRTINCQVQVLVANSGSLVLHQEEVKRMNQRNLREEVIWSGIPDDFDLIEGGRRLFVEHTVTQERLDQQATPPGYLGGGWRFVSEDLPLTADVIDPRTDAVLRYRTTYARRYLWAPAASNPVVLQPAPLGVPGGGGGLSGEPWARDPSGGLSPLGNS